MQHADRATAYNIAYPRYPPLAVHQRWVYGIWEIGNDYRNKTTYYGAYPARYVQRVQSMFPDMHQDKTLHLFSGSLQIPGIKVDIVSDTIVRPSVVAMAECLPFADGSFDFVMADPPYSAADAERYGAPLPNKRKVITELARVVRSGGHLAWLDIPKPMYRKSDWELWGEIGILRSTNHRGRFLFIFEKV